MKKLIIAATAALITLPLAAQDQEVAFPGAEGFGRFTTGGRGGTIIHVTNLNDSGDGSFRSAVSGATKKIVVFDVAGEIALQSDVSIGANTTIAGQTAPGQGITLRYYTVQPAGNNIIMRYIRVRRGQERDVNDGADASWCRHYKNIIIDHCSLSWSIDEVASFYDNRDFTMQWCTIAESLNNAGHNKGAHGYGGIWGGKNASFHHNLIAHVNNRAPRFNGARYNWNGYDGTLYPNSIQAERVDFRNCVMYNWGTGGCYGGPGGGYINMVNNYYKAGPGTSNRTRVTQVSAADAGNAGDNIFPGLCSRYYINGNYVTAASTPENYDWKGVVYDSNSSIITRDGDRYVLDEKEYFGKDETNIEVNGKNYIRVRLDQPIDVAATTTHDAATAFEKVITYAGASFCKDMADARYEEEARSGTATYSGSVTRRAGQLDIVADQGEYSVPSEKRPAGFDSDGDGIPDEWEIANGLDPKKKSDSRLRTLDPKGLYTNIEVYINSLVEDNTRAQLADAIDAVDHYFPSTASAVRDIVSDPAASAVGFEYYSLDGRRIPAPAAGLSIRVTILSDGSRLTDKVIR